MRRFSFEKIFFWEDSLLRRFSFERILFWEDFLLRNFSFEKISSKKIPSEKFFYKKIPLEKISYGTFLSGRFSWEKISYKEDFCLSRFLFGRFFFKKMPLKKMPLKKIFFQQDFLSKRFLSRKYPTYLNLVTLRFTWVKCKEKTIFASCVENTHHFLKEWERFSEYSSAKMFSCLWVFLHCTYLQTNHIQTTYYIVVIL